MLAATMGSMPAMFVGCDRTVHETEKTTTGPNGTSTTDSKTVQHPDGSVSTSTEKKSSTATPPP
jgi:hypothetical protein